MVLKRNPVASAAEANGTSVAAVDTLAKNDGSLREIVAQRLSGAVQIPTVIHDDMGEPGDDPQWDVFYKFDRYLQRTFPRIWENLDVKRINHHALLFTWQGSDTKLKPLCMMAHYDVVPTPDSTLDRWTHPPFSGHYDGEFVWGRGSEDDKSNLVAMLSAIDLLLLQQFKATRTVMFSFGFDEEGGTKESQGAGFLARHLLEKYGEDGIEMIFDEGSAGIQEQFGTEFALLATAEKGYVDVEIRIDMPGGHSSMPPDHTAIGILARAIQRVEKYRFESKLTKENPTSGYLKQAALHAKDMPRSLRKAILDPESNKDVIKYLDATPERRALVRTTAAVDVVRGGDKVNALPESAYAIVNHRIAVHDSVQAVKDHYLHIITAVAEAYGLKFNAFGSEGLGTRSRSCYESTIGALTLSSNDELEPSPVSDPKDTRFNWLTDVIHTVFGNDVVVAPVLETGNTDTQFHWKLSPQIYRMSPFRAKWDPRGTRMHTVDERMPVEGLMEMVKFYVELIKTVDERRV